MVFTETDGRWKNPGFAKRILYVFPVSFSLIADLTLVLVISGDETTQMQPWQKLIGIELKLLRNCWDRKWICVLKSGGGLRNAENSCTEVVRTDEKVGYDE